jgi:hypothetical protein
LNRVVRFDGSSIGSASAIAVSSLSSLFWELGRSVSICRFAASAARAESFENRKSRLGDVGEVSMSFSANFRLGGLATVRVEIDFVGSGIGSGIEVYCRTSSLSRLLRGRDSTLFIGGGGSSSESGS